MQSSLALDPLWLYLSNVCAVGYEFIEEVLLEDNTYKGGGGSK